VEPVVSAAETAAATGERQRVEEKSGGGCKVGEGEERVECKAILFLERRRKNRYSDR